MYVQVTMNNRFDPCRIVEHYEIAIPCFNILQKKNNIKSHCHKAIFRKSSIQM